MTQDSTRAAHPEKPSAEGDADNTQGMRHGLSQEPHAPHGQTTDSVIFDGDFCSFLDTLNGAIAQPALAPGEGLEPHPHVPLSSTPYLRTLGEGEAEIWERGETVYSGWVDTDTAASLLDVVRNHAPSPSIAAASEIVEHPSENLYRVMAPVPVERASTSSFQKSNAGPEQAALGLFRSYARRIRSASAGMTLEDVLWASGIPYMIDPPKGTQAFASTTYHQKDNRLRDGSYLVSFPAHSADPIPPMATAGLPRLRGRTHSFVPPLLMSVVFDSDDFPRRGLLSSTANGETILRFPAGEPDKLKAVPRLSSLSSAPGYLDELLRNIYASLISRNLIVSAVFPRRVRNETSLGRGVADTALGALRDRLHTIGMAHIMGTAFPLDDRVKSQIKDTQAVDSAVLSALSKTNPTLMQSYAIMSPVVSIARTIALSMHALQSMGDTTGAVVDPAAIMECAIRETRSARHLPDNERAASLFETAIRVGMSLGRLDAIPGIRELAVTHQPVAKQATPQTDGKSSRPTKTVKRRNIP